MCSRYDVAPRFVDCKYSFQEGIRMTEELLERYPGVDGIIAGNDMVAVSVYKVLRKRVTGCRMISRLSDTIILT